VRPIECTVVVSNINPLIATMRTLSLFITLAFSLMPSALPALDVTFTQTFAPNSKVTAVVKHTGKVLIENDITSSSSTETVAGQKTVDLGTPKAAGFFKIRFIVADKSVEVLLPVFGGVEIPAKPTSVPTPETNLLIRLYASLNSERAARAWSNWNLKQLMAERAVAISGTGAFGLACAYGAPPACLVAQDIAKDLVIDFTAAYLEEVVRVLKADRVFTASEANAISLAIKSGKVLLGAIGAQKLKEKVISVVEGTLVEVFESSVSNPNAKVTFGVFKDQAKKTYIIFKKFAP
jgi:hypothetical protein